MERFTKMDRYKTEIDLVGFLQQKEYGFVLNSKKSSARYKFLEGPGDEKILVYRTKDNYYRYSNLQDPNDKGTIIDFLQNRSARNLGYVRKILDDYIPGSGAFRESIENTRVFERPKAIAEYENILDLKDTSYLNSRGIPDEVIFNDVFRGTVFNSQYNGPEGHFINTAFPVFSESELISFSSVDNKEVSVIGFEQKNTNYKNIIDSRGHGLWRSNLDASRPLDNLILTEHPVDAMSHYILNPRRMLDNNLYYATFGQISQKQIELISQSLNGLSHGVSGVSGKYPCGIVFAFDNDPAGQRYTMRVMNEINPVLFTDAGFLRDNAHIESSRIYPFMRGSIAHAEFFFHAKNRSGAEKLLSWFREGITGLNHQFTNLHVEGEPYRLTSETYKDHSIRLTVSFKSVTDNWKQLNSFVKGYKFNHSDRLRFDIPVHNDWNEDLKLSKDIQRNHALRSDKDNPVEETGLKEKVLENLKSGEEQISLEDLKISNPLKRRFDFE